MNRYYNGHRTRSQSGGQTKSQRVVALVHETVVDVHLSLIRIYHYYCFVSDKIPNSNDLDIYTTGRHVLRLVATSFGRLPLGAGDKDDDERFDEEQNTWLFVEH